MDQNPLKIYVQWRSMMEQNETPYNYPAKFSRYLRERYSVPAVYRWRVLELQPGERKTVYIGEAEDLIRRIQRVRTPSKKSKRGETNKRLKQIFDEKISSGRTIVLDIADFDSFEMNGVSFSPEELEDQFKRKALENLILCFAQAEGQEILNKVVDPVRKLLKTVEKLPRNQQREFITRLQKRVHIGEEETER